MATNCPTNQLVRSRSFGRLPVVAVTGPATEALERSFKRRRVGLNQVFTATTTSAVIHDLSGGGGSGSGGIGIEHIERIPHRIIAGSQRSLLDFQDIFDTINIVDCDEYLSFPIIEWDFDDDNDERCELSYKDSAAHFKSSDKTKLSDSRRIIVNEY